MEISYQIKELIAKAVAELGIELKPEEIFLEHPVESSHGDYATNVAMTQYKKLNIKNKKYILKIKNKEIKKPLDFAQVIVKEINKLLPTTKYQILSTATVAPPGFINFFLSHEFLADQINLILKDNIRYGMNQSLKGKTLMVEFAHPNTHKMFHIGHLRNITTGEAIVRILEANGAKVIRANYQGDIGMHIAKCLYGIIKSQIPNPKSQIPNSNIIDKIKEKYKTIEERMVFLGNAYALGSKAYEEEETARKEIAKINAKIYNKDKEIWELYQETRQWSLDYFEKIYKRVYTHFDRYYFESEVADLGKKIVLENLKIIPNTQGVKRVPPLRWNKEEKGIFEESEGAIIFDGEKYGLHNRVFINKEGFPTYEAKDIGLGKLQFSEYHPDLIIHVVGPEQAGYFKVVFEALAQLFPETRGKEFHLIYGWVRLKKGKMSSRLGNVVLAEWLIDELKKRLKTLLKPHPENEGDPSAAKGVLGMTDSQFEETIEAAAIAAAKYSFLKVATLQEIAFDIEESVNLQGDSGTYIQYTYARTQSVIGKSEQLSLRGAQRRSNLRKANGIASAFPPTRRKGLAMTEEELSILRTIYKFKEVVFTAAQKYSPNLICEFLYDLSQKYNLFYNKHRILNAETQELISQRLAINEAVGIVIRNGLNLLGIKALEKM